MTKKLTSTQKLRKAQMRLAKELRKNGVSNILIAKRVGVSCSTVRTWLGKQPEKITCASCKKGAAKRAQSIMRNKLIELMPYKIQGIYEQQSTVTPAVGRIERKVDIFGGDKGVVIHFDKAA